MKLFNHVIYSSAMKRRDFADWIEDKTIPVMEVLAQLYLFPYSEYENYWRGELYSRFNHIKYLKGNKIPTAKFMYECTLDVHKQHAYKLIERTIDKESTLIPIDNYTIQEYLNICDEYFKWLLDILEKDQFVTKSEIYFQLDKMNL